MTALPKFEDWTAPWETETGEVEIDKARLKKYLHGLLSDKERLQASVTTVTDERDNLQKAVDEKAREGESEVEKLTRELAEANAKAGKSTEETAEQRALKLEIALEKGLTAVQAKRLVGSTKEELEADADEIKKSWGGSGKAGEEEEEETPPRRRPRRLSNAGDPDPEGEEDIDISKVMDRIPRR